MSDECHASFRDGECVWIFCPMNFAISADPKHAAHNRGNDPSADCPLWGAAESPEKEERG